MSCYEVKIFVIRKRTAVVGYGGRSYQGIYRCCLHPVSRKLILQFSSSPNWAHLIREATASETLKVRKPSHNTG